MTESDTLDPEHTFRDSRDWDDVREVLRNDFNRGVAAQAAFREFYQNLNDKGVESIADDIETFFEKDPTGKALGILSYFVKNDEFDIGQAEPKEIAEHIMNNVGETLTVEVWDSFVYSNVPGTDEETAIHGAFVALTDESFYEYAQAGFYACTAGPSN